MGKQPNWDPLGVPLFWIQFLKFPSFVLQDHLGDYLKLSNLPVVSSWWFFTKPSEKYMRTSNWIHPPQGSSEHENYLSCHHLVLVECGRIFMCLLLPKTNMFAPESRPGPKQKVVFQHFIFRGELLVTGRVTLWKMQVIFSWPRWLF